MTLGELKTRLASLGSDKDHLPVTLMEEHEVLSSEYGVIQFQSGVTDVASSSKQIIIIGQELLVPSWEKPRP